jgi:hypothetical protein
MLFIAAVTGIVCYLAFNYIYIAYSQPILYFIVWCKCASPKKVVRSSFSFHSGRYPVFAKPSTLALNIDAWKPAISFNNGIQRSAELLSASFAVVSL